ncbi:MAG: hypothetical protein GZ091_07400 [Paludibacter sp.]|nr:hypothetical protein [Paludibacter sp.]
MKTSNKLLLGLFLIVVVAIIIINFVLKNEMKTPATNQIEIIQSSDTTSMQADSVAMDEAIQNE